MGHIDYDTVFLGVLNVYCRARGLSAGDTVESVVCDFCTEHEKEFGLSRALNTEDKAKIQDKLDVSANSPSSAIPEVEVDVDILLNNLGDVQ